MSFTSANNAAILAAATNLRWQSPPVEVTAAENPPDGVAGGLACEGAVYGIFGLALRENAGRRRATLEIDSFDATTELSVDWDGTTVTTASQPYADAAAALDELIADFNASAAAATATGLDANGDQSAASGEPTASIRFEATAAGDPTYDGTTSGGSGTVIAKADAVSATFDVYAQPGGQSTAPLIWMLVRDATGITVTPQGLIDSLQASSLSRFAVIVTAVDKDAGDGSGVLPVARKILGTMTLADVPG